MKIETSQILRFASESKSRLDLWSRILRTTGVRTMVEVGVWKGDFARQLLEQCEFLDRYHMIDPWATLPDWNKPLNFQSEAFDDVYAEAMRKTEFAAAKRVVHRGRTKEVIDEIRDGSLDFAYIDGDHTLRGITIDLIKLMPKVKDGGFIGGDDFTDSPWQHDIRFEPTLVCPFGIYFAEAMDLPIAALPFNQFLIQKTADATFSFVDTTGSYSDVSLNKLPPDVRAGGLVGKLRRALARTGGTG
jgi:hypothetical protein